LLHFKFTALNGENIEEAFKALFKNILQIINDGTVEIENNSLKKNIKLKVETDQKNNEKKFLCWQC
jgi:hypothetical protein